MDATMSLLYQVATSRLPHLPKEKTDFYVAILSPDVPLEKCQWRDFWWVRVPGEKPVERVRKFYERHQQRKIRLLDGATELSDQILVRQLNHCDSDVIVIQAIQDTRQETVERKELKRDADGVIKSTQTHEVFPVKENEHKEQQPNEAKQDEDQESNAGVETSHPIQYKLRTRDEPLSPIECQAVIDMVKEVKPAAEISIIFNDRGPAILCSTCVMSYRFAGGMRILRRAARHIVAHMDSGEHIEGIERILEERYPPFHFKHEPLGLNGQDPPVDQESPVPEVPKEQKCGLLAELETRYKTAKLRYSSTSDSIICLDCNKTIARLAQGTHIEHLNKAEKHFGSVGHRFAAVFGRI